MLHGSYQVLIIHSLCKQFHRVLFHNWIAEQENCNLKRRESEVTNRPIMRKERLWILLFIVALGLTKLGIKDRGIAWKLLECSVEADNTAIWKHLVCPFWLAACKRFQEPCAIRGTDCRDLFYHMASGTRASVRIRHYLAVAEVKHLGRTHHCVDD